LGIRNTVTVDLGIIVKRYLLVGVIIFGLVASVGAFLPENLAFADDDDDKDKHEDDRKKGNEKMSKKELQAQVMENTDTIEEMYSGFDLLNSIAQAWNSAIGAIENALDSLQIQVVENTAAVDAMKVQLDGLKGEISESGIVGGGQGTITSYTRTSSGIAISGDITDIMVSCDTGDFAISAENTILSAGFYYVDVFTSEMSGESSWHLSALNSHPTDDIQIDVTVTCIMTSSADQVKISSSGLS